MSIEGYRQQIGVTVKETVINPGLERIQGTNAFGAIGDAVMDLAAPILDKKAEDRALEDAGTAQIAKNPDGSYTRAPAPHKGGTIYMETYDKVTRARQVSETVTAYQERANELAAEFQFDPLGFAMASKSYQGGVLEGTDPEIRPLVADRLNQEHLERQRAITGRTASRDYEVEVRGIEARIGLTKKELADLYSPTANLKPEDREAKAAIIKAELRDAYDDLQAMGAIGPEDARASLGSVLLDEEGIKRETTSFENALGVIAGTAELSEDELKGLRNVAMGRDDPNAPTTVEKFNQAVPNPQDRAMIATRVGAWANELEADRVRLANIAEAERIALLTATATAEAWTQAQAGQRTWTAEQERIHDQNFLNEVGAEKDTPIDEIMVKPENIEKAMSYAGQTGYLPAPVKNWIETRIFSPDGAPYVAQVANNLKSVRAQNGVQDGFRLYNTLSPRVRAMVDLHGTLLRTTSDYKDASAKMSMMLNGQVPALKDVSANFVKDGRSVYAEERDAAIRRQIGMGSGVNVPHYMQKDFDEVVTFAYAGTGNNAKEALAVAARQVSAGWKPSPIFYGEYGPSDMATQPLPIPKLDEAMRKLFPDGARYASFANPKGKYRFKLQPMDLTPEQGLGQYRVLIVGDSGEIRDWKLVDTEKHLRPIITTHNRDAGREAIARERAARAVRARQVANPVSSPPAQPKRKKAANVEYGD